MPYDLLIGTNNMGKYRELAFLLAAAPVRPLSLADVGLETMTVEEPFATYEENARHKAMTYAAASNLVALADDSGLEVDALGGRPGVLTARYAATEGERIRKLLAEMQDIPDAERTAHFVCTIALAVPGGTVQTVLGAVAGHIAQQPGTGSGGFGFDPVFIPEGYTLPFSDLPESDKNRLSHRARAARAIVPYLQALEG